MGGGDVSIVTLGGESAFLQLWAAGATKVVVSRKPPMWRVRKHRKTWVNMTSASCTRKSAGKTLWHCEKYVNVPTYLHVKSLPLTPATPEPFSFVESAVRSTAQRIRLELKRSFQTNFLIILITSQYLMTDWTSWVIVLRTSQWTSRCKVGFSEFFRLVHTSLLYIFDSNDLVADKDHIRIVYDSHWAVVDAFLAPESTNLRLDLFHNPHSWSPRNLKRTFQQ